MSFATTEPSFSFSSKSTSNTTNRPETTAHEQKSHKKIRPNSVSLARDCLSNKRKSSGFKK